MGTKTKAQAANGAAPPTDEAKGPSFDFRRVDRRWRQKLRRLGALEARAQARLQALYEAGDFTDEELDAVMDEADALDRQQDELVAMVLVAVPDGWLTDSAPPAEDVDWSDADSINLIRQDMRNALYQGMMLAAGNPAGN